MEPVERTKPEPVKGKRIVLVEDIYANSGHFQVLRDTETGEHYLSSSYGGIIKLEKAK